MAQLLSEYGVLNEKKDYSFSLQKEMLHESLNSRGTNSQKKGESIAKHSKVCNKIIVIWHEYALLKP